MQAASTSRQPDQIAWRQTLKDYSNGRLPLWRTVCLGGLISVLVGCVLILLIDLCELDKLRYSIRQGLDFVRLVLVMATVAWWGISIMRACIYRTGQGTSVVFSGVVFLASLYYLSQAMMLLASGAREITLNLYDAATNGRSPLQVWADPILGRIVVQGHITHDSDRLFSEVVQASPQLTVVQIESLGGYVNESMAMARLIRSQNLDTVTFNMCASACTLIFVAGRNRYIGPDALFGFHRAGYAGMGSTERLDEADQHMASFYQSMGATSEIGQGTLATPHHSLWKPLQSELFAANYATLRWSERPSGM